MVSSNQCLVLQHAPLEGPVRLGDLLAEAGLTVTVRALYEGQPVPRDMPDDVPLVLLGGAMGVADLGDPTYPFLADEVALLRERLEVGAPVLGICLGAQLLAHAAGAMVYPNRRPGSPDGQSGTRVYEVGWAPVTFHGSEQEPALFGLGPVEPMLHWHGDTFDLPPGAAHLASSADCVNQAFRCGRRAFGLQFHPEVDAATIDAWLGSDAEYVIQACGPGGAERIRADGARHFAAFATARDRLLRNVIRCMLAP